MNARNLRGFTLVELVLVMVIAGILAAVAMPRLVGNNGFSTRGFADELAATLRFAQKLAVAQRRAVFVQITAADASLCYVATTPCPAADQAPGPGGEKPYTITAPNGVAIAPATTLGFAASGRPDITAQLTLQVVGAATYPIRVERETGYVHE